MYIALYSILQKKILFPWCTKNVRKKADVFLVAFDHKYLFLSDFNLTHKSGSFKYAVFYGYPNNNLQFTEF